MALEAEFYRESASEKWSVRLAFFLIAYVLLALLIRPASFGSLAEVYARKFVISTPILVVGGVATMALLFGREAPTQYAISVIKERWRGFIIVVAFFFVGLTAFSTYKTTIPSIVPFYADPWLADLDEALLGSAAWEIAHSINSDIWAFIVFKSYEVVWFAQWFGTVLFVALWSNKIARIRYLWAVALTICTIGTVLAGALASVGPIYYDYFVGGHRFHGLQSALDDLPYSDSVRRYANYLLALYLDDQADLGGGISAMPSLHVGLVALNALFLSSLNRWLGVIGWAFAALIFYGSVYTGWHYAVDGCVSLMVVSMIWRITGHMVKEDFSLPDRLSATWP